MTTLQWFAADYQRQSGAGDFYECTLSPGEILYIPNMWWQAALHLEPSVVVATMIAEPPELRYSNRQDGGPEFPEPVQYNNDLYEDPEPKDQEALEGEARSTDIERSNAAGQGAFWCTKDKKVRSQRSLKTQIFCQNYKTQFSGNFLPEM